MRIEYGCISVPQTSFRYQKYAYSSHVYPKVFEIQNASLQDIIMALSYYLSPLGLISYMYPESTTSQKKGPLQSLKKRLNIKKEE